MTTPTTSPTITQHLRRMRGGAQAAMMKADDGRVYVCKFQNNPQGLRILANEWIASQIASWMGLEVPPCAILNLPAWVANHSEDLRYNFAGVPRSVQPGLCFGSEFVGYGAAEVFDYLPEDLFGKVRNRDHFLGALVLDKWLGNADGRQAVYSRKPHGRSYTAHFIDHGYCFNAGEWTFPESPLRGVFARNEAYYCVTGWADFDYWIAAAAAVPLDALTPPPEEWTDGGDYAYLLEQIASRVKRIPNLIQQFKCSSRYPFPQWSATEPNTA